MLGQSLQVSGLNAAPWNTAGVAKRKHGIPGFTMGMRKQIAAAGRGAGIVSLAGSGMRHRESVSEYGSRRTHSSIQSPLSNRIVGGHGGHIVKRQRSVTLADVAKDAGVSVMTVSNVVRGRQDLVKLETRRRVEHSISRLKYRPNASARNLRLSEDRSIGIVIADTDPAYLTDPFISRLISGLSNYLSKIDFTLDVQGVQPERFGNATILRKAGNDGLCAILCGPRSLRRNQFEQLQALGPPIVVFQEIFRPTSDNVLVVRQDDRRAGRLLGEHVLERGVRSVAFVVPMTGWCAVEERQKGLEKALEKSNREISFQPLLVPTEKFEDVSQSVTEFIEHATPDVIVAATDSMAVAVLNACQERGLKVPEDVLVAGFNGFDVWRLTTPTLTTVVSPAYEMGQLAGEMLIDRLNGRGKNQGTRVFPVTLQEGGSTQR